MKTLFDIDSSQNSTRVSPLNQLLSAPARVGSSQTNSDKSNGKIFVPTGNRQYHVYNFPTESRSQNQINEDRNSFEASGNFVIMSNRVKALLDEDDLQPTAHAYGRATQLITELCRTIGANFPKGSVAVSEDSDIYIYWRKSTMSIEYFIPAFPSNSQSMYVEKDSLRQLTSAPTMDDLVEELTRFISIGA